MAAEAEDQAVTPPAARPRGSHRVTMTLYEIDPDAFCSRFYKTPMTSLISQWNG
jgi:hypothetical protein